MQKSQVVTMIVDVLKSLQSATGREPRAISGDTCPIGDLDSFDSLNGVEATVELSERLGFDLPGVNSFVNEQGDRALKVSEIADHICALAERQGK